MDSEKLTALQFMLQHATSWSCHEGSDFLVHGVCDGIPFCEIVTAEDLESLEPRLSAFLTHATDTMVALKLPGVVTGTAVRDTVANWRTPFPVIEDMNGARHLVLRTDILARGEVMGRVEWRVVVGATHDFIHNGKQEQYIAGTFFHIIQVPDSWMTQSYPGWQTKFDLAESLNLDDEATVKLVLNNDAPTLSQYIDGVVFD